VSSPPDRERYWFPAKRYGWGWGPPVVWQGWVVLIVWGAVLIGGMLRLQRAQHLGPMLAYVTVMSLLLIAICYAKGERPRWRWGDRDP
jgi:hypothetical protein